MKANVADVVSLTERYRRSIEKMRAELDYPEHIKNDIINYLIRECEQARTYARPEIETRKRDTQALSNAKKQAKHARELAKYLTQHPTQTMIAVMSAILMTGVHLRTEADDVPISKGAALSLSQSLRLSRLLNALADELERKRLLARNGPMSHRNQLGPL